MIVLKRVLGKQKKSIKTSTQKLKGFMYDYRFKILDILLQACETCIHYFNANLLVRLATKCDLL